MLKKITLLKPPTIGAFISILFSAYYIVTKILNSHQFQNLKYKTFPYFNDDRDGWLKFASLFPDGLKFHDQLWQINFWPPGNIGVLTLGRYLTSNLYGAALFHIVLVTAIQSLLTFKLVKVLSTNRISNIYVYLLTILYHISFIYKSSFVDTVLQPDYLASASLVCSIIYLHDYLFTGEYSRNANLSKGVLLLSFSSYLRITGYLTIIIVIVFLIVFAKKINRNLLIKLWAFFGLSLMLLLPWIGFRAYGIYNGNLIKGAQFSMQGNFALQHQWDTLNELESSPGLEYMGLGVACKVDKIKCIEFSSLRREIKAGKVNMDMETEFDLRSKAAIKTFLSNPIKWLSIKLPVIPATYFQKSVYESPSSKMYYSPDLIIYIFVGLVSWLIILKLPKTDELYFVVAMQLLAMILLCQLVMTQVILRFYLPIILLTLSAFVLTLNLYLKSSNPFLRKRIGYKRQ